MLLPLLLLLCSDHTTPPAVYRGRSGELDVRIPRQEAEISVDGELDEAAWATAALLTGFSQFLPTDGRPTIPNLDYVLTLDTPELSHFSGNIFFVWGHDENFFEWASAKITWLDLTLDWRPTGKLRVNGLWRLQYVGRRSDGSTVDIWRSPRLKVEYQLSRPIFLRLVGEYTTERRDGLRDDTRTGAPILVFDPAAGDFQRAAAFGHRSLCGDFLFSYQPNPGTVLFAGYGSTLRDPTELGRASLRRAEDGFFLKLSYLLQM